MNINITNRSGIFNYEVIIQSSGSQSRNHLKGDGEFTVGWLVCMYCAFPVSSSMGFEARLWVSVQISLEVLFSYTFECQIIKKMPS